MTIRKATLSDVDWLVDIGIKDMFSILGQTKVYNPEYLRNVFIPFLISSGIVLVVEEIGAIIGHLGPHPFNPEYKIATEFMWWVREDKRNSSTGYKLLLEFEKEAISQGANFIALSLMASSNINSLEKRGYKNNESSFLKEI